MVGVRSGKGDYQHGVGKRLRKAREKYRLSIADISDELRIPIAQLRALEEEDYSVFSAELYARGAYTAYAKYLGVYTAQDLRTFLRSLTTVRKRIPLKLLTPHRLYDRLLNPRLIIIALGLCLAFLVGGYIAWQLQSFWRLPSLVLTSPLSSVMKSADTVVEGRAEDGARVKINGEPVLLHPDATFSVPLTLHIGINPVKVEVTNAAGRTREKQLFLLREQ